MPHMKEEYIEKIYAGWLGKIIGIRFGAPVEGWSYEKIKNVYGTLTHYPVDYRDFAADDDSNGPLFFLRALEDGPGGFHLTPQAVGEALLNYAPFEHGFFWWGGYGVSTEHTAYLNLRSGVPAPRSGSIAQNGAAVAEQIGGQIFIDTWGLVAPGNPDLAAEYAQKAASVTHDGNGVYGGIFIAVCISLAFEEQELPAILEKALSYLPESCEYTRVVRAVTAFHQAHPEDWRRCRAFLDENFGYQKYPGNCHIIPNAGVIILSLLYGEGDFDRTLSICNMCGWDTDCNVGNVGAIMGVRCGLAAIDYDKWRRPINDFLACSSVVGSLNSMDIPYGAGYIARLAYQIAGEPLPPVWDRLLGETPDSCHFEYPGSTHAMRVRAEDNPAAEFLLKNTDEAAHTGRRSLKCHVGTLCPGGRVYLYKKTYYRPADFHDSRYDPSFSPVLYPGQTIHGSAYLPEYGGGCTVRLYARNGEEILLGEAVPLEKGVWRELSFTLPALEGGLIDEAGFAFDLWEGGELDCLVDDFWFDGQPQYTVDFRKCRMEAWTPLRREVSQFTRLKGLCYLEGGQLHLSGPDMAEAYTGRHDWKDYTVEFTLTPLTGENHFALVRVQGASRCYAVGFGADGRLQLRKNETGYRVLAETHFPWEHGREYTLTVIVRGNVVAVQTKGCRQLFYRDPHPYLTGGVGVSVSGGSHCSYREIRVAPVGV